MSQRKPRKFSRTDDEASGAPLRLDAGRLQKTAKQVSAALADLVSENLVLTTRSFPFSFSLAALRGTNV